MHSSHSEEIKQRLSFARIDAEVVTTLVAIWPKVQTALPAILDRFYAHISAHYDMRVQAADNFSRLKRAQSDHWERLFTNGFDADYVASVRRIGHAHVRIGLEPRWFMGAYQFILDELLGLFGSKWGIGTGAVRAQKTAITRAVLLDMEMAVSIYQEEQVVERERRSAALASAIATFEAAIGPAMLAIDGSVAALDRTASELTVVAGSTDQQADGVERAVGTAASGIQASATASEEMTASIAEIGNSAERSAVVARSGLAEVEQTRRSVQILSETAERIGSIVGMINAVAAQTNLLALNATIEAARAGDAGRGFAVVAAEVKSLAGQTARATDEITAQVTAIQQATQRTVGDIERISGSIGELTQLSTAIAAALEQQSAAVSEISRSMQEAAVASRSTGTSVGELRDAAASGASAAGAVGRVVGDVAQGASVIRSSVAEFFTAARSV